MDSTERRLSAPEGRMTHRRGPYLLIGVLVGVIVMQWAMPVAHGVNTAQAPDIVVARNFVLVNDAGEIVASFFVGDDGPVLAIGKNTEPNVTIATTPTNAFVIVSGGQNESSAALAAGPASPAKLEIHTEGWGGGGVFVRGDNGSLQASIAEGYPLVKMDAGDRDIEMFAHKDFASLRMGIPLARSGISLWDGLLDTKVHVRISGEGGTGSGIVVGWENGFDNAVSLLAHEDRGGEVLTTQAGIPTGRLPSVGVPTAGKPTTWGQIKESHRER